MPERLNEDPVTSMLERLAGDVAASCDDAFYRSWPQSCVTPKRAGAENTTIRIRW